jgi:phosphocarrier protein
MECRVIESEAKVINSLGLHARPAAQLVRLASNFVSEIHLLKDGVPVNGKSIMGVMMLAAECGSTIGVRTDGADEEAAMAAIVELIATGFGET